MNIVSRQSLSDLATAGALRRIVIERHADGWIIVVAIGQQQRVLQLGRTDMPRVFKTIEGAVGTCQELGFRHVEMDLGS